MDFDSGDYDADYESDSDEDSDAEMSDDGASAEGDYELNSAESDQMLETEQACTLNYDADDERNVEGHIIMDAWDAKGTWYDQSYSGGDDFDDESAEQNRTDSDESEESDETEEADDESEEQDSSEDEEIENQKLGYMPRKSRFTNDGSAHFIEPHNEETGELAEEEEEEEDNWLIKLKKLLGIYDEDDEDDDYY